MLEWRSDQNVYDKATNNRNTSENCLCEDKAESKSKTQEELSPGYATNENNAGKKVFFLKVVCLKKY